ncbi:hypothetical protein [Lysinibacillus xylanilyticus]|uniref:hypothetical protein n=1 Tax=Lysinibacillus xylanilyticus TaxID=582475 RepID=UPI003D06F241
MGISNRGTKAKRITSCDNAFVTNIMLARDPTAKRMFSVRKRSANVAAAMFYLCESATTAKGFYLRESEAAAATTKAAHRTPLGSSALRESEASAANVLSVRKRSDSNKAPSRNGNQPPFCQRAINPSFKAHNILKSQKNGDYIYYIQNI